MNLTDLAAVVGITRERVRQILDGGTLGKCDDVDRGSSLWSVGRKTCRKFLESRGVKFRKMIVVIASMKGGIGKTLITSTVAVRASNMGAKVLIIDLDPEACATNYLLEEPVESDALVFVDIVAKNKNMSPL